MNKTVNFITKQLKYNSVKEFLGSLNLSSDSNIDKAFFNEKLIKLLQLDQVASSILFRFFDSSNKGQFSLDEFTAILGSFFPTKSIISKDLNPLLKLKDLIMKNNITVYEILNKINSNPPNNEYHSN